MLNRITRRLEGSTQEPTHESEGIQGLSGSVLDLVPVQRLYRNMLVMNDGTFLMILRSGAVNFDLKSGDEQIILLETYGELLNALSIDFPVQVLLHSAHLDTQRYMRLYQARLEDPNLTPQMRHVIEGHLAYFEAQARSNYLLDRSIYLGVPYLGTGLSRPADGGVGGDMPMGGFVKAMFDKSTEKGREPSRQEMDKARLELERRCALLINQLSRLTIRNVEILDDIQIVSLMRELYNPGISERQKIRDFGDQGDLISVSVRAPEDRRRGGAMPQLGPGQVS